MACKPLLQTDGYRVVLYTFATLALVGNAFSFIVRTFVDKTSGMRGFGVLVVHLCVSDFLMGVYLAVIGVADGLYRDDYLWQDAVWKRSHVCRLAGFLCLLSSEISAFIIFLITLDRYLVFRFPFRHVHFSARSARLTVAVVWTVGLALSTVPALPVTSHWKVYSYSGTCLSLPFSGDFSGRGYSFGVIIVLNFVLFVFVAFGQSFIYLTVQQNSMSVDNSTHKRNDINIAHRLIAIAVSDFLCWFPVGVAGLLASTGTVIPQEMDMAVAVSVMPLNSALNPFWYTLNMVLEKMRMRQEQRILQALTE